MIEGSRFSRNFDLETIAAQYSFQNINKVDHHPLPDKLVGIKNIVLLVDTTSNDNLDDLIIQPIPTEGIEYEETSQFLFEQGHKFDDASNPLTITLQFKLGLEDDGTSMNDLLLRANFLTRLGFFKFKVYIFKVMTDKKKDKFIMPPLHYFTQLKCVGFRFDTDIFPVIEYSIPEYLRFDEMVADYFDKVCNHMPLNIDWLGEELEELHLGQKLRVSNEKFCNRRFPKLTTLGVECYDIITMHNFEILLKNHGDIIRNLTLRDSMFRQFQYLKSIERFILIAHHAGEASASCNKFTTDSLKEIHMYGFRFPVTETTFVKEKNLKKFFYSIFYEEEYQIHSLEEDEIELLKSKGIETIEVPFLPYHKVADMFHFLKTVVTKIPVLLNFDIDNEKLRRNEFNNLGNST
ncbi:hypothetical protein DFJ63DRAFT_334990 [Scheffersomyces coipomensis]|uniref:uncharacterized protein n=1 Tax=Scheffersomyces coipomensis TaxID=1788519 RepID=UPI00315C9B4F